MKPIAEVIASSTGVLTAEIYDPANIPALGEWVSVSIGSEIEVFGVVSFIEMQPYDEGRTAVALRKTEDELRRELPQIMALLRTVMQIQMVAHRIRRQPIRQTLPPYPPRIHAPVSFCPVQTVRQIGRPFDFLRVLLAGSEKGPYTDELLVAVLTKLGKANQSDKAQIIVEAGKTLSRMIGDDVERLQSILRRVA